MLLKSSSILNITNVWSKEELPVSLGSLKHSYSHFLYRETTIDSRKGTRNTMYLPSVFDSLAPTTCFLFVWSTRRSNYNIRFAWTRSFDKLISAIISHAFVNTVIMCNFRVLDAFASCELMSWQYVVLCFFSTLCRKTRQQLVWWWTFVI